MRILKTLTFSALSLGVAAGFGAGCAPSHVLTNAEIPQAQKLGDLMWSQASLTDPAFKKSHNATFTDADYAEFAAAADAIAARAAELSTAAAARDPKATSAALMAVKDGCRSCHKQFK